MHRTLVAVPKRASRTYKPASYLTHTLNASLQVLEEVMSAMFVAEAAAYIQSANVDLIQADAVRNAVVARIDLLDANFLASLNGYVKAANDGGDAQLSELLVAVADEVLRQVALRLPSAARVLDLALKQRDKDARVQVRCPPK